MKKLIILLLVIIVKFSYAQLDSTIFASYDSTFNYYTFQPGINFSPKITSNASLFGLGTTQTLALYRADSDKLVNSIHYRYYEYYNGIKVEDAQFYIHVDSNNNCISANGELYKNISAGTSPGITDSDAIKAALAFANDSEYAWQDTARQNTLQRDTKPDSSYYPVPTLVIINVNAGTPKPPVYILAYKVAIVSSVPHDAFNLYVDASSGNVVAKKQIENTDKFFEKYINEGAKSTSEIKATNLSLFCSPAGCQTGSTTTLYYGNQTIYTDKISWCAGFCCNYRLKDVCTGTFLYVRNSSYSDFHDLGNTFNDNTYDEAGGTALWCLRNTEDYYESNFGRHSYSGSYSQVNLYVGVGSGDWTGSEIDIPQVAVVDPPFCNYMTSLDIIGHEFTHGVTQYSAALNYYGESGALNESFSDIFGVMVRFRGETVYSTGHTPDFLLGTEAACSGNIRDMANPHASGDVVQPNTYLGTYWQNVGNPNDNGGVHINSGVPNYWFYLIAQGGSGTNDNGNSYCVSALGNSEAARIAYRTLTVYLSPNSNFNAARNYSIQAAADLYGAHSNEVAQVTQAWYAVGVGPKFTGTIVYNNLTVNNPNTITIAYDATVEFDNLQVNPGASIIASSNTLVDVKPKSDIESGSGSHSHLFIAPVCGGNAARYSSGNQGENGNNNSSGYTSTENSQVPTKDSLRNPLANRVIVSPNPSSGLFNVQVLPNISDSVSGINKVSVLNLVGQIVLQSVTNQNTYVINLSSQPKGMYFIKIENNKELYIKKVVVQ